MSTKKRGQPNEQTHLVPPRPTVRYDSERSIGSRDSLAPPDVDEVLQKRRVWWRSIPTFFSSQQGGGSRKIQVFLTCLGIGLSAVQANGVYCWPTYGPVVAEKLELTGPQAQTIAVGGILGVYLLAAPLGALTDRFGPRFGSLISATFAAAGYLGFAGILSVANPDTPYLVVYLTLAFGLVGAATVGTYFACLTCASLTFPDHPTLALSVPLSLLGLSSLFLSAFSSIPFFLTPASELIPIRYLVFLGILCPAINLFAAIFMKVVPPLPPTPRIPSQHGAGGQGADDDAEEESLDDIAQARATVSQSLHLDERSPLIIGGFEAALEEVEMIQKGKSTTWSAWALFTDWGGFWVFGVLIAMCIGPSETMIASIGTVLTSLLPPATTHSLLSTLSTIATATTAVNPLALRNKHVMIISLTSTISRLLAGVFGDYLCPPIHIVPLSPNETPPNQDGEAEGYPTLRTHKFVRDRPIILNRSTFAALCALGLASVFGWCAGFLESERGLWVLSAGAGMAYGLIFTLAPAIISTHYGPTSFGLAWGMVSYFAALGSVLFSYLYALLSAAIAEGSRDPGPTPGSEIDDHVLLCHGPKCFQGALGVGAGCALIASIGFVFIGRRWRV